MTDISLFEEPQPTGNEAIETLLKQARELIDLETQIADLNNLVKTLSGRANDLKTKIIPDQMAEIGLSEFSTPEGHRLKVEDFVSGSLPKDPAKRSAAIEALQGWGADGIIRNELNMVFEKSQHNEAMSMAYDLRKQGYDVEVKSGVHPQTYLACIRERLANGEEVDPDTMGVFIGRKTKLAMPKGK